MPLSLEVDGSREYGGGYDSVLQLLVRKSSSKLDGAEEGLSSSMLFPEEEDVALRSRAPHRMQNSSISKDSSGMSGDISGWTNLSNV